MSIQEYQSLLERAHGVSLISFEDLGFSNGNSRRSAYEYFREPREESLVSILSIKEIRSMVAEAIDQLPENERMVLSMYYHDELTMKEIGLVMGITESRISQIHNKAIIRMRGKLKRSMGQGDLQLI